MYAFLTLLIGFILDMLFGDPLWLPHPVVAMGKGIAFLEKTLRQLFPATPRGEIIGGAVLVVCMCGLSFLFPYAVLAAADRLHPWVRPALESVMCYQVLAAACLRDAALRVYTPLAGGDIGQAREAVGRIVGRDVQKLDADGVARATVETIAENTSDGVVAPMLFFALGGAPLAFLYKAINTMDSMLGYKNDAYLYFGRAAARLDDAANYIPARLTAWFMVGAAFFCGYDWRRAAAIYRRDRNKHASPNSAHPESAAAGALGLRLGGASAYGGRLVAKPTIGDAVNAIRPDDIVRANRLLGGASFISLAFCCTVMWALARWADGGLAWM